VPRGFRAARGRLSNFLALVVLLGARPDHEQSSLVANVVLFSALFVDDTSRLDTVGDITFDFTDFHYKSL
jgi:hypothetical protein